jgi:poly(3-hydroxyalkanoate) synthetase
VDNPWRLYAETWLPTAKLVSDFVFAAHPPKPTFATLDRIRLELATMELRERTDDAGAGIPVLIVAPFALHDASIVDFSDGHSVAQSLAKAGAGPIAAVHWKSATREMQFFSIDAYLADLNVAVDDLGGRAALVGMCQGGWLACAYAARFPEKVGPIVLAGAPIDLAAAESALTKIVTRTPPEAFEHIVASGGGRIPGQVALWLWSLGGFSQFDARDALQRSDDALEAKFRRWSDYAIDLPGVYFLQTVEWLFRENRLALGTFPALGRPCDLGRIRSPIFVLAAEDDEIIAPAQALAPVALCRNAKVETRVMPGRHLSLFLGCDTVSVVWPAIGRWLKQAVN